MGKLSFSPPCRTFSPNSAMKLSFSVLPLLLFCLVSFSSTHAQTTFDVTKYGADSGGQENCREAFSKAWAKACDSFYDASIVVPRGTFKLNKIEFNGPCNNAVTFSINGRIVSGEASGRYWITFREIHGLTVSGAGCLDGNGDGVCHSSGDCATSLLFSKMTNLLVTGITSFNSQRFHMSIYGSNGVAVKNVLIKAPAESQNTDGIHLSKSSKVEISNSEIQTGDDCISILAGVSHLLIGDVACGPGHGISIGSLGRNQDEEPVEHITVQNVVLTDTSHGVRIKTWATEHKGSVSNVVFKDITMYRVRFPIVIDQNYRDGDEFSHGHYDSGIKISNIKYDGIRGTTTTGIGARLWCSDTHHCTNITMTDIKLFGRNNAAESSCENASGQMTGDNNIPNCL